MVDDIQAVLEVRKYFIIIIAHPVLHSIVSQLSFEPISFYQT